jgi:NTP pyrophosphatase (non-canonical NTP hydrolase)
MCDEAWLTAEEHGWHEYAMYGSLNIPEKLALVHSEISEALESYRDETGEPWEFYVETDGKPEGFCIELADAVIRIADLCGELDIDLEKCIKTKMKYNETRPYRHGGKKA